MTEQPQEVQTVEQTEDCPNTTEDWTVYRITYEDEGEREKTYTLNPDATIFVPTCQKPQNVVGVLDIVAPVTSQALSEQQGLQDMQQGHAEDPAPSRRSPHIAIPLSPSQY